LIIVIVDTTSENKTLDFFTETSGRRRPLADTVCCVIPALFGGGTVNVPTRVAGIRYIGAVVVAPRGDVGSIAHIKGIRTTV